MKIHDLKSWVGLFEPIFRGEKTHDLRVMDRDFQIGDQCLLREWDPIHRFYTGRECLVTITYITSSRHQACAFSPVALHEATGILSITRVAGGPHLDGPAGPLGTTGCCTGPCGPQGETGIGPCNNADN